MTQLMMDASKCDICGNAITDTCIDGRTKTGQWGLLCPGCHRRNGVGLGIGKGQLYTKRADGTFWKDGTGPPIADKPKPKWIVKIQKPIEEEKIAPPVKPTSVVDRTGLIDLRKLHGQCDPILDRDRLKKELGLTDAEIDQIKPKPFVPDDQDDDPWFN
jgi:hypothetical protein